MEDNPWNRFALPTVADLIRVVFVRNRIRMPSTRFVNFTTVAWLIEKGYSVICFSKPSPQSARRNDSHLLTMTDSGRCWARRYAYLKGRHWIIDAKTKEKRTSRPQSKRR